eukprot:CAMPEP_0184554138 /NCGR_PEP_ID=MMETSP0199_2-20130426/34164_1 /TAXON_ID=1112570 /ORGANISM="Thraustochytrium sp., Strain LLF1b" /LENGTH=123 /DNA_ID=CAMNT_0026950077 /DNA_START=266 /DNA_END=637 /DNA_ORIENTATION=-
MQCVLCCCVWRSFSLAEKTLHTAHHYKPSATLRFKQRQHCLGKRKVREHVHFKQRALHREVCLRYGSPVADALAQHNYIEAPESLPCALCVASRAISVGGVKRQSDSLPTAERAGCEICRQGL